MQQQILKFWFEDIDQSKWWIKDPGFDQLIIDKFTEVHFSAEQGELFEWRINPKGRLAEILLLDQFSRNIYRESAQAFACDAMALVLAQEAVASGMEKYLSDNEKMFLFLPFMHSESLKIHDAAVELFKKNGLQDALDFEYKHRAIIERFGRYPHRNHALGRTSTSDELTFLKLPNSSF